MVTRVSTQNITGGALTNYMRAQQRQFQAQAQVGSEKRATDHKGYGREAEALTAIRGVRAKAEAYAAAGVAAADRAAAQNLYLEQAGGAGGAARQALTEALANGRAEGLLAELQTQFQTAVSALNGKHQGRYLFAGATVDKRPIGITTLAELAAAPTTASVFGNDDRRVSARLDDSTTVQTGMLADDVGSGLFEVFRRIKQFADGPDGPLDGKLTAIQTAFLETELVALKAAHDGLIDATARNGGVQNQIESVQRSQQGQVDQLDALLVDKTGVNMAEAITKLQLAETAVQASARVLSTLRSSSLLELLR